MRGLLEDEEGFVEVMGQAWEAGEEGKEDVGYETVGDGCEGGGEARVVVSLACLEKR